jgi:hypothetical protein
VRLLAALALGLTALWFGFVKNDWLDTRPVQRLLFIGHSRTYYNDMPDMVAKMADSAGSPIRYEVTMLAFGGATAKDHWNSQKTRAALARADWDRLILQPDYVWRHHELESSDLYIYAPKILEVGFTKSQPAVISDWTFRDPFYHKYSWSRAEHYEKSQSHYRALAYQTGAQLIDVARVWEGLHDRDLSFSLYKDDDHPTLEGTYLVAFVVYAELSGHNPSAVTYVPWGMEGADAEHLRQEVSQALGHRS